MAPAAALAKSYRGAARHGQSLLDLVVQPQIWLYGLDQIWLPLVRSCHWGQIWPSLDQIWLGDGYQATSQTWPTTTRSGLAFIKKIFFFRSRIWSSPTRSNYCRDNQVQPTMAWPVMTTIDYAFKIKTLNDDKVLATTWPPTKEGVKGCFI